MQRGGLCLCRRLACGGVPSAGGSKEQLLTDGGITAPRNLFQSMQACLALSSGYASVLQRQLGVVLWCARPGREAAAPWV